VKLNNDAIVDGSRHTYRVCLKAVNELSLALNKKGKRNAGSINIRDTPTGIAPSEAPGGAGFSVDAVKLNNDAVGTMSALACNTLVPEVDKEPRQFITSYNVSSVNECNEDVWESKTSIVQCFWLKKGCIGCSELVLN
jgi:hypothetical protein